MATSFEPVRFFMGANTPTGFYGYHKTDLYDPRGGWVAYLIKSGAGTGKATFMREVSEMLTARGLEAETVYCSSDPTSLDAVCFPSIRLCVIDATAPHIIEPYAYGECEQLVPFGCCLQTDKTLEQADAWFEAADACSAGHARCCRFLAAAAGLLENNRRLAQTTVLHEKLQSAANRWVTRECGTNLSAKGRETRRFLSAVTPKGAVFFKDSAAALCPKLYVLEDEYGAVSASFIPLVRDGALAAGREIITCFDALYPTVPRHVLIPSLGVGLMTSDSRNKVDFPVYRRLHASRFLENDALRTKKQQLHFNRRAAAEMLREAALAAEEAKRHHDRMEDLHVHAMDWELWRQIADRTLENILAVATSRIGESNP